jgi:dipeptidyl-peptidase-4
MHRRSPHPGTAILLCTITALWTVVHAQPKERLTFDQIFKNAEPRVTRSLPTITRWVDSGHFIESRRDSGTDRTRQLLVNAATGDAAPYIDLREYADVLPKDTDPSSPVATSEDNLLVLYRAKGDLFLLEKPARTFRRLTATEGEEQNPVFSPDGKHVAFTRAGDLYSVECATGRAARYTADGSGTVYNGWASWVYYEEILGRASRYRAFWWSPDSRHLAFYRFDDTAVPEFPLHAADGVHGSLERARYPKPGDPNPEVRIGIAPLAGGPVVWAAFNEKADQYFGAPFWTPDGAQIFIQWMNRAQDTLILYGVSPATGVKQQLVLEHQPSWVDWFEAIQYLPDRSSFILQSDRDGWPHLYLHNMDGTLRRQLTAGAWPVTGIQAVDTSGGLVYFTARKESPTRTDLYSVRFDGKGLKRVTFGKYTHTVKVSPAGQYFITTYSTVHEPPRMALLTGGGRLVRELGDSKTEHFSRYELALPEMITIPTSDELALPAVLTRPLDFDPAKKYPVLLSVYGGPQSATVFDGWKPLTAQWLAQQDLIQLSVDNRGSGHFGKTGAALMHRNLGKWEMRDLIDVVTWLRTQPFVDSTRVGITGGSYGGYVTALALTAGAGYFTHGIAEYSVTDWRLYDTHYAERYMDMPSENPDGYREGSVLTHAHKYRGMLRLVHGTMDDNVHMQNTLQLADTLQDLNRSFELMLYPGGRHGWGGPKAVHLRTETYRFYYRYLLQRPFPEKLFKTLDASSLRRRP